MIWLLSIILIALGIAGMAIGASDKESNYSTVGWIPFPIAAVVLGFIWAYRCNCPKKWRLEGSLPKPDERDTLGQSLPPEA
jgi:hypothetical protein